MILSRHLYALDEVQSALHESTTRNNVKETVFWCHELIQSGCASEAISTLFDAWIWQKGAFHLSWLLHAGSTMSSSELSETDILLSAYQHSWIPYYKRDNSIFSLLALSSTLPERVTYKTPILPSTPLSDIELYLLRALYQGKGHSAWWSARQIDPARLWELLTWYIIQYGGEYTTSYQTCFQYLQEYENLLGFQTEEYDMIMRCIAVCACCLSVEQRKDSFGVLPKTLPDDITKSINEWTTASMISQRKYPIPQGCLYGRTQRGHMKWAESTIPYLNSMENHLIGCPFWEEALSEYTVQSQVQHIQWKSYDAKEAFYDRYLPDDHPDEWKKADKAISHGDGIMGPRDSFRIEKYVRLYFSRRSRLAWNRVRDILATLEHVQGNHPQDLLTYLLQINQQKYDIPEHHFDPVHRICRV